MPIIGLERAIQCSFSSIPRPGHCTCLVVSGVAEISVKVSSYLSMDNYLLINKKGYFNDMWLFDLELKQWAWIGGSNEVNVLGVYGTRGLPSADNWPGGRQKFGMSYNQNSGTFYTFGGSAMDSQGFSRFTNDVWRIRVRTDCRPGFRFVSTTGICQLCAIGMYKSDYGDKECLICPMDSSCTRTAFSCDPGFELQNDGTVCRLPDTPIDKKTKEVIWILRLMRDNMEAGIALIILSVIICICLGFICGYASILKKPIKQNNFMTSSPITYGTNKTNSNYENSSSHPKSEATFTGTFEHSLVFPSSPGLYPKLMKFEKTEDNTLTFASSLNSETAV